MNKKNLNPNFTSEFQAILSRHLQWKKHLHKRSLKELSLLSSYPLREIVRTERTLQQTTQLNPPPTDDCTRLIVWRAGVGPLKCFPFPEYSGFLLIIKILYPDPSIGGFFCLSPTEFTGNTGFESVYG